MIRPEDKRRYYELVLDCLRFDKRNIETSLKCRLADSFLKFQGIKRPADGDRLTVIRKVFKYLLSDRFESPSEDCFKKDWG